MLTDAELLHRYAEGKSEEAFAELVRRYVDLVYSAALRQVGGDAHAAQDVAQVVFTALAQKAAALVQHPVLAGWLYTATQHAATKVVRSAARRHAREQEAHAMHEIVSGHDSAIDWQRVRPVLDEAMRELGERDREAVLLRFFARRPFSEIGAALNLSEDAARMRVERALDKLHGLLARRGVTSTSGALAVALTSQAVTAAPAGVAVSVTGAALAGAVSGAAAVSGVAGVGVFAFMSTAKIAATVAVIGGLAGLGFGLHATQQRRAAEESARAAVAEQRALHARMQEAETRVRAAEARAVRAEARAAEAPKAALPTRPGASGSTMTTTDLSKAANLKAQAQATITEKMTLLNNPDVQRTRIEMERLGMGVRYAQLYRMLNLTPDQIARFEARWIETRHESVDFMAAAQATGVSPSDPAILALAQQGKASFERDLRGILGEAGFAEYQRYERTYAARESVSGLLGNLAFADAPLSREQVNQLTLAIAEQSPAYRKGDRVPERAADVDWSAVVAQAQPFLSPVQLAAVRSYAAHAQASQQAMRTMNTLIKPPVPSGAGGATSGLPSKPPGE